MNRSGENPLTAEIDHLAKDQDVPDCPAPLMAIVLSNQIPYD
jgi:hypothetical protein